MTAEEWADRRSVQVGDCAGRHATDDPIDAHQNRTAIAGAIVALEAGHLGVARTLLTDSPTGRRFLHERNNA